MTSEQLKERAQKFLDGAEWDAATVGGEQEIRLLTSLLASIRAETLEEAVGIKVADGLCVIGRRCLNALENHQSSDGLKDEIEAAMANLNRIIAAIRDAGKKE